MCYTSKYIVLWDIFWAHRIFTERTKTKLTVKRPSLRIGGQLLNAWSVGCLGCGYIHGYFDSLILSFRDTQIVSATYFNKSLCTWFINKGTLISSNIIILVHWVHR